MTRIKVFTAIVVWLSAAIIVPAAQKVETKDGVRLVHNQGRGIWGKSPGLTLEKIRTLGDIEAADENVTFYMPQDIALDPEGNLYVLDTGNHRIQKFSPQGEYLTTFGREGQGPGEFNYPGSLDFGKNGELIVASPYIQKIQFLNPEGKETKSLHLTEMLTAYIRVFGPDHFLAAVRRLSFTPDDKKKKLERLMQVMDREGKLIKKFGEPRDYKNKLVNSRGNQVSFTIGNNKNIYLAFQFQNRVEKFSQEGKLLWSADRKLNYNARKPINKGKIESEGGGVSIESPEMNKVSESIAVDSRGLIWVITLDRQLKEEEEAYTSIRMTNTGGSSSISMSAGGSGEATETDAYKLEVFDKEGVLLGSIPLDHFADLIRIQGNRLFILDKLRRMQVHEYKIQ